MSPARSAYLNRLISFPRVSGDEPITERQDRDMREFSPRERG